MRFVDEFERLSRVCEQLVDRDVGLIDRLTFVPRERGAPNFFHCAAEACRTQHIGFHPNFRIAGGASTDPKRAAAKAIGEAIERYCSAIYSIEYLPLTSRRAATFSCVSPSLFELFDQRQYDDPQFQYVPFSDQTTIRWVPSRDCTTDKLVHVPAATVFMPYQFLLGSGDEPVVQSISTGLACHVSREEAVLTALCEVVERDAFTITWQAKLAPPQVRIETLSDENYDLVRRFETTGDRITLFNITTDLGIPTILASLTNSSPDAPAFVVAAASSLHPEEATRKSLEELAHTRRYSQQLKQSADRIPAGRNFDDVVNQVDHLNFWCDQANLRHADFLFASSQRIDFDEIPVAAIGTPLEQLAAGVDLINGRGLRVLATDLTTDDVRPLGFHVTRVVVPGLHPLFMGFRNRALGGTRLRSVPEYLGYRKLDDPKVDVPHPYP